MNEKAITSKDIKRALLKIRDNECYKPPVKIYEQMVNEINTDFENEVMIKINAIVDVDKEELVKALNYDRDQYHKGFEDGMLSAKSELEIYIKALDLACSLLASCSPRTDTKNYYIEQCLQIARDEE